MENKELEQAKQEALLTSREIIAKDVAGDSQRQSWLINGVNAGWI